MRYKRAPMRRLPLLTLTLLLPSGVAAAPASAAGTYTVAACTAGLGAGVWTASATAAATTSDGCAAGPGLGAALPADAAGGTAAGWRFTAPDATRIVRLRAERRTTGVRRGTRAMDAGYLLTLDGRTLERCDVSDTSPCTADLDGAVEKAGLDGRHAEFRVTCQGGADERCSVPLRVDVRDLAIGLADPAAPVVSGVRTLDDGDRSGVLRLAFDATDAGGGLLRVVTLVDGAIHAATPLGGPACAPLAGGGTEHRFATAVPCPGAAEAVPVEVRAAALPPGPHAVEVRIEDAAGNTTTVLATDFPRLNASGAQGGTRGSAQSLLRARVRARFVAAGGPRLTSRFGERVVIRGDLRDPSGRGVSGARLDVVHVLPGGRRLVKTGLKTRERGRFTLILPRDLRSRRIEIGYRALRPGPVTSRRTLRLTVRGGPAAR